MVSTFYKINKKAFSHSDTQLFQKGNIILNILKIKYLNQNSQVHLCVLTTKGYFPPTFDFELTPDSSIGKQGCNLIGKNVISPVWNTILYLYYLVEMWNNWRRLDRKFRNLSGILGRTNNIYSLWRKIWVHKQTRPSNESSLSFKTKVI